MKHAFKVGDTVELSAEGLYTFRNDLTEVKTTIITRIESSTIVILLYDLVTGMRDGRLHKDYIIISEPILDISKV